MTETNQLPNKTPYKGSYREDVWKEEAPASTATPDSEPTPDQDPPTAPENEGEEEKKEVNWEERYSNLRSYTSKQINTLNSKIAELQRQHDKAETPAEKKVAREKVEAFRKKYDDVYEVIESTADDVASSKLTSVEKKLEALENENLQLRHDRAKEKLLRLHPDFEDLNNSDEFHSWVSSQPQELQDWLYKNSTDADKAAYVVKLYKQEKKPAKQTKAERQKEVDATTAVKPSSPSTPETVKGKKVWKLSEINSMLSKNPNLWEDDNFEREIDIARMEGRLVDDVSK